MSWKPLTPALPRPKPTQRPTSIMRPARPEVVAARATFGVAAAVIVLTVVTALLGLGALSLLGLAA